MNAHKRFLNELRAPMKRYNRKMNDQRRRKAAMPQAESSSAMDSDELMKELEAKFDELFGTADDE